MAVRATAITSKFQAANGGYNNEGCGPFLEAFADTSLSKLVTHPHLATRETGKYGVQQSVQLNIEVPRLWKEK